MRTSTVLPTGLERRFDVEDIIVTKTDPRGVITYANDVFLCISAYRREQVIGRPHNIIRHPDMPRCIFKLLWDTLGAGREIFAYIVNLAGDGAHYWVLAHVTPSYDRSGRVIGYHSNRRAPDPAAVRGVVPVYAQLREVEQRYQVPADGLAASTELLHGLLADRGLTYDEFAWDLTNRVGALV